MSKASINTQIYRKIPYLVSKEIDFSGVLCENRVAEFECRVFVTGQLSFINPGKLPKGGISGSM